MKKNIKSVLAKALAVAMAVSLAGVTPGTDAQAAKKPVSVTKKVTVKVGKTKKVKVTTKKKVKKTTWSLTKAGKKVVKLSKKKKKNVTVKGKKAGKATLTAKVKIGKKTYKLKTKITVKKATPNVTATPAPNKATPTPVAGGSATTKPTTAPTKKPTATEAPVGEFTVNGVKMTVNEADTYSVALTALNETTFSSYDKRPAAETDDDYVALDTFYNKDGSVTWTSAKDYNSGLSFYINPCTDESQIVDISETRGEGFLGFMDGTKDMSAYDYIRVKVTSAIEMNVRTYCGNGQLTTAGFPGSANDEKYEGGWIGPVGASEYMESDGGTGQKVKDDYVTRTLFIPVTALAGTDMSQLTAIAFCPQRSGEEVTLHAIDFVKVKYDVPVTEIEVTSNKTELAEGKVASVTANITPDNATRKIVKWESSDEDLATVNFKGQVVAGAGQGTVTITATSTDGSNVSGSVDIVINPETSGNELPAKSATVALNAEGVVGNTNTGSESIAATQEAAKIEFMADMNMAYVDLSAYLTANNIDLTIYDAVDVSYQVVGADGAVVTTNPGAGYGKVALVDSTKLNGYDSGINKWLNSDAERCAGTATISLVGKEATEIAAIAGINMQLGAVPEGAHIEITGIKFVVDYNTYTALNAEGIVGNTNTGSESIAATQEAAKIEFMADMNMAYVDLSAYLTANNIDLTNYKGVRVSYQVVGADGAVVTTNPGAGYGKIALVDSTKLNGYDSGINKWLNSDAERCAGTVTISLEGKEAAEIAAIAGINMQLGAVPEGAHIEITEITFTNDYDLTIATNAEGVVGNTNTGSESVAATQEAAKIEFMADMNMAYVDLSAYLEANAIDLTIYDAVAVSYQVVGADGAVVTTNPGAGYGKIALVDSTKLNGYDSGINKWLNSDAERCAGTATISLVGKDATEIAAIAGINMQLGAVPEGAHIEITGIKLVYSA